MKAIQWTINHFSHYNYDPQIDYTKDNTIDNTLKCYVLGVKVKNGRKRVLECVLIVAKLNLEPSTATMNLYSVGGL